MDVALHQILNAVTMFTYEMSIALHLLVGCVARHSMANYRHHTLFWVQSCMLAFPGKLSFSLQSISKERGPSDMMWDLISVCTSNPALVALRKLLQFSMFPFLPSMAVYMNFKPCKRPCL